MEDCRELQRMEDCGNKVVLTFRSALLFCRHAGLKVGALRISREQSENVYENKGAAKTAEGRSMDVIENTEFTL